MSDKQATIMLSLITDHGRATPLVWLTVDKDTLGDHPSLYEHRGLVGTERLPADIKVCVVADRGFGDQKLYRRLTEELCFDYVIRVRGNIAVTATTGETRTAAAWVRPGGRARVLRRAAVTADHYAVGPFAVPSGLHALRSDPDDAGSQVASADASFLPYVAGATAVRRRFRAGLTIAGSHQTRDA